MLKCPSCTSSMTERMYEGVAIDQCASCGGTWLDDKEIRLIVQKKQETFSEEEQLVAIQEKGQDAGREKDILCPRCNQPMPTFQYAVNSGVFLNRCPNQHGLWLDPGELEKVQIVMEEFDERYASIKRLEKRPLLHVKQCPRCQETLGEIGYESEKIDVCPQCKGAWCEGDELRRIIESREKAFSEQDHQDILPDESKSIRTTEKEQVASLGCVACGQTMKRLNYAYTSGVVIDRCPHGHGVWLDKDELERIQVFAERWETQEDRVAKQYAEALKKARKESDRRYEEAIQSIRVSRFGPVNRLMQSLARKGFF